MLLVLCTCRSSERQVEDLISRVEDFSTALLTLQVLRRTHIYCVCIHASVNVVNRYDRVRTMRMRWREGCEWISEGWSVVLRSVSPLLATACPLYRSLSLPVHPFSLPGLHYTSFFGQKRCSGLEEVVRTSELTQRTANMQLRDEVRRRLIKSIDMSKWNMMLSL